MKYGIVGNRIGWDKDYVIKKIEEIIFKLNFDRHEEVLIISGGAVGIDTYALNYAEDNGLDYKEFIPIESEPSPERYFNRNRKIVEHCDILIAFDKKIGASGTKNTIRYANELNKEVIIITTQVH